MVECIINPSTSNTTYKNPFGTEKDLQNKKIVAIETFSAADISYSPISPKNPVIPINVFLTSFVTFYRASIPAHGGQPQQNEGLYYDLIPMARLRTGNNYTTGAGNQGSTNNNLYRVVPTEFSWTKSYVTCTPAVGITQPYSALFLIHYLNENQDWTPYM